MDFGVGKSMRKKVNKTSSLKDLVSHKYAMKILQMQNCKKQVRDRKSPTVLACSHFYSLLIKFHKSREITVLGLFWFDYLCGIRYIVS